MFRRISSLILTITIMGSLLVPTMAAEIRPQNQPLEKVHIQLGSQEATIKGQPYMLNASPEKIGGTTYIPLDLVSKALNAKIEWLQASKKLIIIKENEKIDLTIGDQMLNINGRILIPLRMISDRFNLEVRYNGETGRITLVPLVAPIAQFKLLGDPYIAGRDIGVVNESYSPDKQSIVESLWEITGNNKSIKTRDLNKSLKLLQAGTYNIKLKVRDVKGAWSGEAEEIIQIQPHPKPEITSFTAIKQEWDQGETLEFEYEIDVESWVDITESRWTYYKEGETNKTIGRPRALFEEGTYTIGLQIKDNYDTWSLVSTTEIHVNEKVKSTELAYKFGDIRPGEIVDNFDGYNYQNYDPVENFTTERQKVGLLFSNSPETVLQKGILYADKAVGETRVLYHHRNGMKNSSENTRLVIVLENKGNEPVTIKETKKSNAGPTDDILHLGQIVTRRYFNSKLNNTIILKPNEKKYIYDTATRRWGDYESFSGIIEFTSDKTVTVTVAAVDKGFQLSQLDKLPILPRDGVHTRGTFPDAHKYYNISIPGDRPSKMMFGQREDEMDEWISGYDALTGVIEQNKGNYGVVYELDLTSEEKTGILLNPRGTSFKGASGWQDTAVVSAPQQGVFVGSGQSAVIGVTEPRVTRKLFYSLSNGSSGPVLFNFIPESFWKDYKIDKESQEEGTF